MSLGSDSQSGGLDIWRASYQNLEVVGEKEEGVPFDEKNHIQYSKNDVITKQ